MNFDSIILLNINQLRDKFDSISIKIDETLQNNDIFENIELRNKVLQRKISQAENQVDILEKKVEELDQLNRSLNYNADGSKCFNSGQSGIEVSQQNGNSLRERKKLRRNH
jgi:predicted RNase H-like nuclease (RuvC/YqgF family)